MNKKDDKKINPSFPAPYEYLNEELAPHFQRFHELEGMRKVYEQRTIKPKDFKPALLPPEYSICGPSDNQLKNSAGTNLEFQKLDLLLTQKIERLIEEHKLDADLSRQLRDTLLEKKYPNPFKDKGPKEFAWLRTTSKDIETSAQFLLEERQQHKAKVQLKETWKEVLQSEINQKTISKHGQAVKSKFMSSLSYVKAKETSIEKLHDFTKDKDFIVEID